MRLPFAALISTLLVPGLCHAVESTTVLIPMRDGISLATNTFYPAPGQTMPTLLIRTPYGKDFIPMPLAEQICDDLGYALVVQDTRGRGDSEGVDDVFLSDGWAENQDGVDTLDWIVAQPWSNGEVGMIGASALGITAYLAGGTLHPALKALHVGITPSEFYEQAVYQGGVYREALVTDWLGWQDSLHMLELYQDHPVYDEVWASLDLRTRYDAMTVPIYHWGGWYDIFAEGPVAAFEALQDGGPAGLAGPQKLLMGPWTHVDRGAFSRVQGELTYPENSLLPLGELNPFKWFDRFLQEGRIKTAESPDPFPVRYYVMGDVDNPRSPANRWERARQWPVPGTTQRLYLAPGGGLSFSEPSGFPEPMDWTVDPADPTGTIGGRELSLPAGPRDQAALLTREDALVFQTPPLTEAVKVVGTVKALLWIASDAEDTDVSVRLMDVYPDGRSMLVTDGILKARHRQGFDQEVFLTPGVIEPFEVEIGTTAILFEPGHRIQILLSSSNHRRFKVGNNTADPVWSDEPAAVATNTVYLDEIYDSHLLLPTPRRDAVRPGLGAEAPADAALRRAQAHARQDLPLSAADRDALAYDAGRRLMEALDTHTPH